MVAHEEVKFWRVPQVEGLELLRATYITQNFSRHMHDGYALGVVEGGVQAYYYRGANHAATAGCVVVCSPGEVHTGHAGTDDGWTYRMFYPDTTLLHCAASEVAGRNWPTLPFMSQTVIDDPYLASLMRRLHLALENLHSTLLELQGRILFTFAQLVMRHAENAPKARPLKREADAIKRVRTYIDDHYQTNISLDELANIAHLSSFYLVRAFAKQVGLPPHAYLIQTRIMKARTLLRAGMPIAQVAVETGFVDQSHFHRHFKRIIGITPHRYS